MAKQISPLVRVPEGRGVGAMVSVSISDCDTEAKGNRSASHLTAAFEALFFWSTPLAIGSIGT
jgi:hypothetical protein